MGDDRPWTTPSDLAEYAFCPRAYYYRRHGEGARAPSAVAGEAYHRRALSAERWRDEHRLAPWLAVAAGVGVLAVAVLLLVL